MKLWVAILLIIAGVAGLVVAIIFAIKCIRWHRIMKDYEDNL